MSEGASVGVKRHISELKPACSLSLPLQSTNPLLRICFSSNDAPPFATSQCGVWHQLLVQAGEPV